MENKKQYKETQLMLIAFAHYINTHKGERFWQALKNWNQQFNKDEHYILTSSSVDFEKGIWKDFKDTFCRGAGDNVLEFF